MKGSGIEFPLVICMAAEMVAVGTRVAPSPPHRSRRAAVNRHAVMVKKSRSDAYRFIIRGLGAAESPGGALKYEAGCRVDVSWFSMGSRTNSLLNLYILEEILPNFSVKLTFRPLPSFCLRKIDHVFLPTDVVLQFPV